MLKVDRYVDDRPDQGVFRVNTNAFSDPELLDLEFRFIFERTWSFLGLETQVSQRNDFITSHIGRVPVLVTRDDQGQLRGFLNLCRHKGALLCRSERGNARVHYCQYHGWAFEASGKLKAIKALDSGNYSAAFHGENHDLLPLARLESYRGVVFGSLNADVPPLAEYLQGARAYIDLAMDQSPNGMEIIPGRICYSYAGNWKLQMDNGLDHYHLASTHTSFLQVQSKRAGVDLERGLRQYDWQKRELQQAGVCQYANGHAAVWIEQPEPERRPIYPSMPEIRNRVGSEQAEWMLKLRNASIFPNLQIAESTSLLFRTFRPISVNETEMRVFCLAPIGESIEQRNWRIRQYEDFFNPSGLATPDDTSLYDYCQRSFAARPNVWLQGHARGMGAVTTDAQSIGAPPGDLPLSGLQGPFNIQNELSFQPAWREWARLLSAGAMGTSAYPVQ